MKIQKALDNVERVKNKTAVMPLTMEDAVQFHNKVIDKIEKDRKEVNKTLGLGDIEKNGFTGSTNKKVTSPELKKMKLSESRFTDYVEDKKKLSESLDYINSNDWGEEIKHILFPLLEELFKARFEIFFGIRGEYTHCNTVKELIQYLRTTIGKFNDTINQLESNQTSLQESLVSNFLVEDWDDYIAEIEQEEEEEKRRAAQEEKEQAQKEKRDREERIRQDERIRDDERKRLQAKDRRRQRKADAHIDATTGEKQRRRAAAQAEAERRAAEQEEEERQAAQAEEEARKAEEERKRRIRDQVASEKDWVKEREIANREGRDIDFTGYSDEEQQAVKDYLDDFDNDETQQAAYLRKYKEETDKKAKEAEEQRKKEQEERRERRVTRAKKLIDIPNRVKGNLRNLGINIKY